MDEFNEKLFPFTSRNKAWAALLAKGYCLCVFIAVVMAALLNSAEGEQWFSLSKGAKVKAHGDSAFDECLWFTITALHGISFGEFATKSVSGDWIISAVVAVSYWCSIFMAAIVMMSQLPGCKAKSLSAILEHIASVAWPSYLIVVLFTLVVGHLVGPYALDGLSPDAACSGGCEKNFNALGFQWLWSVVHRAPYGGVYPDTPFGRVVTIPAGVISYLYPPYVLALIAIRRPTPTEHSELLAHMNAYPEQAMGPGYIIPAEGPRELQVQK